MVVLRRTSRRASEATPEIDGRGLRAYQRKVWVKDQVKAQEAEALYDDLHDPNLSCHLYPWYWKTTCSSNKSLQSPDLLT